MNTLVRNTTSNLSRRFNGYEPLDHQHHGKGSHEDYDHHYQINFSKRRKEPYSMVKSFSYRRNRARQRQIFLKSYTLSSIENQLGHSKSGKLKKAVVKVKTVMVSVVAFMRLDSLRSCNSRTAIAASSPSLVRKFF